jgi:polyisoprenoid-binding protein YceI
MISLLARIATVGLVGSILLHSEAVLAQSPVDFSVSGNSTVRSWTCHVRGTAQVTTGSAAAVRGFDGGVQTATLTVPVSDFECPEDEMREHLLEAMRAQEFPSITFRLDSYQPSGQGAVATGSLTILTTTHAVTFPIFMSPSGSGVQIEGELPLDMTTYGVQPPVVLGGLLRVRPQIRIQFSGTVTP